ncbi:MAG: hypothetical protein J3R72DRAFT_440521 [Linnemannia gamsii]|nr:MAG: hypothetical protein J3R72DRAFT_440521 [Linnemannia gamsii]
MYQSPLVQCCCCCVSVCTCVCVALSLIVSYKGQEKIDADQWAMDHGPRPMECMWADRLFCPFLATAPVLPLLYYCWQSIVWIASFFEGRNGLL